MFHVKPAASDAHSRYGPGRRPALRQLNFQSCQPVHCGRDLRTRCIPSNWHPSTDGIRTGRVSAHSDGRDSYPVRSTTLWRCSFHVKPGNQGLLAGAAVAKLDLVLGSPGRDWGVDGAAGQVSRQLRPACEMRGQASCRSQQIDLAWIQWSGASRPPFAEGCPFGLAFPAPPAGARRGWARRPGGFQWVGLTVPRPTSNMYSDGHPARSLPPGVVRRSRRHPAPRFTWSAPLFASQRWA